MIFIDYEIYKKSRGVYEIICIKNNFRYIGATFDSFKNRFQCHKSHLRNNKHGNSKLQSDFNKYGEEYFEFRVIYVSDDKSKIKEFETYNIDKFKSENICYNFISYSINVGNCITDETREKMSLSHKGTKLSDYQKSVLIESNKNKCVTKETREKLSIRFSGSKSNFAVLNEDQVKDIKILLMDGFDIKYIADKYNVKPSCINNIRKNYRWKHVYVDGFEDFVNNMSNQWHRLSDSDVEDILNMLKDGRKKWDIHLKYGISYDKINSIISKYCE